MDWEQLRENIPALDGQIYFNTGVSGAPPLQSLEEELHWARYLATSGPGRPDVMEAARERVEQVRQQMARFIGGRAEEIAFTQSCSDGIALVAAGLRWQKGDEVIVSDLEHVSGLLPWIHLQRRDEIVVRYVTLRKGSLHVDDVAAAISPRTKLICMSHVAYNTGARLPVEDVATLAREKDVLLLVDGAQGPGHVDFDVKRLGCHFYACAGQKWLLGPDGTGALYIEEESLERVIPALLGWASVALDDRPVSDFRWQLGAARFEVAGKHVPSLAALGRSVDMLHNIGMETVAGRIAEMVGYARSKLARVPGLQFVTPADESLWTGLIVFTFDKMSPDELVQTLWERHRIVCRTIPGFQAVRISIHAYNTVGELDVLIDALNELAS